MLEKAAYWLGLADDDLSAADVLLAGRKHMHALFYCHLAIEKALKAVIVNITDDVPPKIHDLSRLAERGEVLDDLTERHLRILEELNPLYLEARYPGQYAGANMAPGAEKTKAILDNTGDLLCWIKQRLGK